MKGLNFSKKFSIFILPLYGIASFYITGIFSNKGFANEEVDLEKIEKTSDQSLSLSEDLYILGPGDILAFEIYELDEDTRPRELKILNDGNVIVPYIGSIKISGLSLEQAKIYIESQLSKELIKPSIGLELKKERPLRVGIYGEINRPGIYTLGNFKDGNNVTILDAIQKGGGVTPFANLRNVSIKRRLPGEDNEYKVAKLDLLSALIDGQLSQNILLFDGDSINLTKARDIDSNSEIISNTNAASEKILVSVVGGVVNPGQIILKNGSTLNQAILFAGGPVNFKANRSNVQLIRINNNGTISSTKHKFSYNKTRSKINNPILKEGDIVRVPQTILSKTGEAITLIGTPIFLLDRLVNSVDNLID